MKKAILLTAAGFVAFAANAQIAKKLPMAQKDNISLSDMRVPGAEIIQTPVRRLAAKATQTVIGTTETFSTASMANWTAVAVSNLATFAHATAAANAIPALASPSAADGWALLDMDACTGTVASEVTFTSPSTPYNLTGHANVGVTFYEYHLRFQDSLYLEVSTDGFSSFKKYSVKQNNTLKTNDELPNAYKACINISDGITGNPANVRIRFHWYGSYQGYGMALDDLSFVDLDNPDVRIQRSALLYSLGNIANGDAYIMGNIPPQFVDTIFGETYVSNYGTTGTTGTSVNMTIAGPGPAYTQTQTKDLKVTTFDTVFSFINNRYVAPAGGFPKGIYAAGFTSTQGASVNHDTVKNAITDTSWSQSQAGFNASGYYVYKPTTTTPEIKNAYCTYFIVPDGKTDTISSVQVSLHSGAGQIIKIDVYTSPTQGSYNLVGTGKMRLAPSDVSTSSIIWTRPIQLVGDANNGPVILTGAPGGEVYYVVLSTDNATAQVVQWQADAPAFTGYYGIQAAQSATQNDGQASWGTNTIYTNQNVPCTRLNFNTWKPYVDPFLGVGEVAQHINTGMVYPNPANTQVTIPFNVAENGTATVKVTNTLGQVVKSQSVNATSGNTSKVTFTTSDLASGVYFYSIDCNGQRATERFVVAH